MEEIQTKIINIVLKHKIHKIQIKIKEIVMSFKSIQKNLIFNKLKLIPQLMKMKWKKNIFKIIISDIILVFIGIYIDFKLYLFIKNKPRIATNYSLNNFLQIIKKKEKRSRKS